MVNNLFKIIKLLPRAKALPVKQVFIYKFNKNNVLFRQKAQLVLRGNKQRLGINYGDTFAGVVRPSIFKLLIALVAVYNLEYKHLDVITAFLNRKLDYKNIYIQLLEGYHQYQKDGVAVIGLLLKALYPPHGLFACAYSPTQLNGTPSLMERVPKIKPYLFPYTIELP